MGQAFLSGHARAIASELAVRDNGIATLTTLDGTELCQVAAMQIAADPPLGTVPRKLFLPDGTMFETEDQEGVEAMMGKTRGSLLHELERFQPRLLAFVAILCVAIWLIWRYGLDVLASIAVALTPPILVEQIDRGTIQSLDLTMASPTRLSQDKINEVQEIFADLVNTLNAPHGTEFELLFRSVPGLGPNAFALPGGTIVMTDAFVRQFPDQDVLAGVLGHELGHAVGQHGLKQFYRSLGIFVLIAFLSGDTGPILEDVLLEGNVLLSLSFSRAHERQADAFGIRLSRDAGYDPAGLKIFFDEVAGRNVEAPKWLSSHPPSAERSKAIDGLVDALE